MWRKEAPRVRPPMSKKEIFEVFVRVQEHEYYDRIMLLVGEKFAEIVKVNYRECVKNRENCPCCSVARIIGFVEE